MNRIKYILIASFISVVVLIAITYFINLKTNNKYVNVAVAGKELLQGDVISMENIIWAKVDSLNLNIDNYITQGDINELKKYVLNNNVERGQVVSKKSLIKREQYLEKTEGLEYIAIPIKSTTEGVCYKLKKGDKISVYYTAKRKLVDEVLKDKKKIYSVATSETMVTCLLYENIEIIAMTNSIGQDVKETGITDIVVRLTSDQALELVNLKEQGTFTLSLK